MRQQQLAMKLEPPPETFDGDTFISTLDGDRLAAQLNRVRQVMLTRGGWFTLAELAALTGAPESSVSARLRDLRKPRFGSWTVERRRRGGVSQAKRGLFEYRVKL